VSDSLLAQPGQLAVRAGVFMLGRGLAQHRPDAFAGVVAPEQGKHLVTVEPAALGVLRASVHFDPGGIDHEAVDASPNQQAVQPPAVPAGLQQDWTLAWARGRNAPWPGVRGKVR